MKKILFVLAFVGAFMLGKAQFYLSSEAQKFVFLSSVIQEQYVDTVNEKQLYENAINGMLEKLDPHSKYIPAEEVQKMNEPLQGSFSGIGVTFQMMEDTLLVIQTISGAPAEKVGIRAGDRIIAVDGVPIAGVKMSSADIQKKIRGENGSLVVVTVVRRSVPSAMTFKIVRGKIPIYCVDAAYMVNPEIGYIKLNRFSANTLSEFFEAVKKLDKVGMKSLILDLQGNGGGYLSESIALADQFLKKNSLIVYTNGKAEPRKDYSATASGYFQDGYKIVVLVDESSASASEIVSGAIQDWDRGLIVGRRTFGKGLVQKLIPLPDGSEMRLTNARYYTPSGRCIQKPYKDGETAYDKDLIERYNHGELMHEDSIVFPDSLKYKTLRLGRTVYGGGGIMPDVFVPIDTGKYSKYYISLVAKGVINKYVLNYVEKNRETIAALYDNFGEYSDLFDVSEDMLKEVIAEGEKESVKYDEKQFNHSKSIAKMQIKAMIARDVWGLDEYYKIMNNDNEIYKKAVEILKDDVLYENGFKEKKRIEKGRSKK